MKKGVLITSLIFILLASFMIIGAGCNKGESGTEDTNIEGTTSVLAGNENFCGYALNTITTEKLKAAGFVGTGEISRGDTFGAPDGNLCILCPPQDEPNCGCYKNNKNNGASIIVSTTTEEQSQRCLIYYIYIHPDTCTNISAILHYVGGRTKEFVKSTYYNPTKEIGCSQQTTTCENLTQFGDEGYLYSETNSGSASIYFIRDQWMISITALDEKKCNTVPTQTIANMKIIAEMIDNAIQ